MNRPTKVVLVFACGMLTVSLAAFAIGGVESRWPLACDAFGALCLTFAILNTHASNDRR